MVFDFVRLLGSSKPRVLGDNIAVNRWFIERRVTFKSYGQAAMVINTTAWRTNIVTQSMLNKILLESDPLQLKGSGDGGVHDVSSWAKFSIMTQIMMAKHFRLVRKGSQDALRLRGCVGGMNESGEEEEKKEPPKMKQQQQQPDESDMAGLLKALQFFSNYGKKSHVPLENRYEDRSSLEEMIDTSSNQKPAEPMPKLAQRQPVQPRDVNPVNADPSSDDEFEMGKVLERADAKKKLWGYTKNLHNYNNGGK